MRGAVRIIASLDPNRHLFKQIEVFAQVASAAKLLIHPRNIDKVMTNPSATSLWQSWRCSQSKTPTERQGNDQVCHFCDNKADAMEPAHRLLSRQKRAAVGQLRI